MSAISLAERGPRPERCDHSSAHRMRGIQTVFRYFTPGRRPGRSGDPEEGAATKSNWLESRPRFERVRRPPFVKRCVVTALGRDVGGAVMILAARARTS